MSAKSPKPMKSVTSSPTSGVKRTAAEAATTDVKPKKAACAYMIWLNEVGRKEIIAKQFKGDSSKVTLVMKAAGEIWKKMSDADKKQWNAKAEADKARHAKEMETYVPSETSGAAKKKGKKGKKEKDPNKPKKGLSGYMFFVKENRADIIAKDLKGDGSKVAEVTKIAGKKWRELDAKGREKYEKMAAEDKKRWEKEMAEYKKNNGGDDDDDDEEDEE
jgi:hypothetical protein